MKTKLIIAITAFFLLIGLAFYYLNKVVLPSKLKTLIIDEIQKTTGRTATLASVDFSLFKGFSVNNLTVFEKDLLKPPLFHVNRVSFRVLYYSIIKDKKIVIPALRFERPSFSITRQVNDCWNVSDIIDKQIAAMNTKSSSPFSLIVGGVNVEDARVKFSDQSLASEFTETINNIDLKVGLALPTSVKFTLSASISDLAPAPNISLKGDYNLVSKKLNAQASIKDLGLVKYLSSYYNPPDVYWKSGVLKKADIMLTWENHKASFKSNTELSKFIVVMNSDKEFQGNPSFDVKVEYDSSLQRKLNYQGVLNLNLATISGLPVISHVDGITGKIFLEPDKIKTDFLNASIYDTRFSLSGTLNDFAAPTIDVNAIASDVDIAKIQGIFPKFFEEKKIQTSGKSHITFSFKGPLSSLSVNAPYKITAILDKASLSTLKPALTLSNIAGKITYEPETLTLDDIKGIFNNSPVEFSGNIKNLSAPLFDLRGSGTNVDLESLSALFPELLAKAKIKKLHGKSNLTFDYKGTAVFADAKFNLIAQLIEATLSLEKLPTEITGVSGKLSYAPDKVTWENLKGSFKEKGYALSGKLNNFAEPSIKTTITGEDFDLTTGFTFKDNTVNFSSLNGQYHSVKFDVTGDMFLSEETAPRLDLSGSISLNLEKLGEILPKLKSKLSAFDLKGPCAIKGSFKGKLNNNWRNWQILANITSPEILAKGYRFKDLLINLIERDEAIEQLDIAAGFYEGALKIAAKADLSDEEIPYSATLDLSGTDLAKLKSDTIWKNQNVSGIFSANLLAKGPSKNPEALTGEGSILIKDGRLWQLNLLKGLGQFLFIPEFENIIFSEAKGDFVIQDKKVSTSNFELKSNPATLTCAGWADFAGNINFDILTEFSEDAIAQSASLKKLLTSILTQGDAYLAIKLTGNLNNPKYTISPAGLIEKTKNIFMQGFKSIFE